MFYATQRNYRSQKDVGISDFLHSHLESVKTLHSMYFRVFFLDNNDMQIITEMASNMPCFASCITAARSASTMMQNVILWRSASYADLTYLYLSMQLTSNIVVVILVVAKMMSVSNSLMRTVNPTIRSLATRTMYSAISGSHSLYLIPGGKGAGNGERNSRFTRLSLFSKLICGETIGVINCLS